MPERLNQTYQIGQEVQVRLGGEYWQHAIVVGFDAPGLWVQDIEGRGWFVTNTRHIRASGMRDEVAERLLALNADFYTEFAEPFAETRATPQPGFARLLNYLPVPCLRAADVGCGNGRFGRLLAERIPQLDYTGIDFAGSLLALAANAVAGTFLQRDISRRGFMHDLERFDLCVCLATMQHIPGRLHRLLLLREMSAHVSKDGRIFLSNWQFGDSSRQQRKILEWDEVGLTRADVEANDYLISWQRNGRGMRYVHLVDPAETAWLADMAGLEIVSQFYSDGKEGNLNLYTILSP